LHNQLPWERLVCQGEQWINNGQEVILVGLGELGDITATKSGTYRLPHMHYCD